ncbi:MAG: DUF1294 domain-containing protein [Clostridiales bacterium]|nr:DUF1294 domain-containing protein [Clostridiales bacterium]
MDLKLVLFAWLVFINLFAIALYGIDKRRAIKDKWRISEATLLLVALIGGGCGALAGMKMFRHKTQKAKFFVGVPVCIVLNVVAIVALFIYVL